MRIMQRKFSLFTNSENLQIILVYKKLFQLNNNSIIEDGNLPRLLYRES